ncbi:MAG: hypothetical protein ABI855_05305 [Bacteroidota bacterium]
MPTAQKKPCQQLQSACRGAGSMYSYRPRVGEQAACTTTVRVSGSRQQQQLPSACRGAGSSSPISPPI